VWGENKPEKEFHAFWEICQPFLFGTVGAAVIFSKIDPSQVVRGLAVIFLGVGARWFGTFFAAYDKKFTVKERALMAFAWIPKATVQAAIGGLVLADAKAKGIEEFEEFGQAILTTAVLAICITAPAGAIFINTLGTKWLEHNPDWVPSHG
jgi:NhaP-type Na+/H+ or K+/H+ antiporter